MLSISRIMKHGFKKDVHWSKKLFFVLCTPILPIILLFIEGIALFNLEHCNQQTARKWQNLYIRSNYHTTKFIRTELGLEATFQIAISITLLMFSKSETRIEQGLKEIFDSGESTLGLPVELLLIAGILWSYKQAWTSYVRGISLKKDYFPIESKLFIGLYVLISITIKVSIMILYLAPCLGLFNVLRHYQGELLPYKILIEPPQPNVYTPEIFKLIDVEKDYMYYSNAPPIPWRDITRFDYTNLKNPIKPPMTLYTVFSTKVYLAAFWIIVFIQPIVTFFIQKYSNPTPFARQDWLDKIIHAMENSQIPSPVEDFEEKPGTVSEHVTRSKKIIKEMGSTIVANFFYHIIMLAPIFILCKYLVQLMKIYF